MKNKEDAKSVYMDIVMHSWTYHKMTLDEQQRCLTAVFDNDVKLL